MWRPCLLLFSLCFSSSDALSAQIRFDRRPSIYLLTFGKGHQFIRAQARIAAEAATTGLFDHIYNYSGYPDFILNDARWNKHLQRPSVGAGFWFWKAPLIKNLLNNVMAEGDILVYADAGSEFGNLTEFGDVTKALCSHDLVAFSLKQLEQEFTKGDVFAHFDAQWSKRGVNLDSLYATHQICATYLALKNTAPSRRFIDQFEQLAADYSLISDAPSVTPNAGSFIQHRRDQSLFSMLVKANSPDLDVSVRGDFQAAAPRHPTLGVEGFHPFITRDIGYPPKASKHWILAARNRNSVRKFTETEAKHLPQEEVNRIKDLAGQC